MNGSRSGSRIKNDTELSADGKNHRHFWQKQFTTFLYICLMIGITVFIIGIIIFAIILINHWVQTDSWQQLQTTFFDVLKFGGGFLVGLLSQYGVIKKQE